MERILEVNGITKKIKNRKILDNVILHINSGEIVGLVGSNGAGKTSLMKLIAGYNFPTAGTITICGHDVGRDHAAAMKESAFLVENPGLYPDGIFLLRKRIEEAAVQGTSVLISSHLLSELEKTATRFLFLRQGKIIGEESMNTAFSKGFSAEISLTEDAASESSDGLEESREGDLYENISDRVQKTGKQKVSGNSCSSFPVCFWNFGIYFVSVCRNAGRHEGYSDYECTGIGCE